MNAVKQYPQKLISKLSIERRQYSFPGSPGDVDISKDFVGFSEEHDSDSSIEDYTDPDEIWIGQLKQELYPESYESKHAQVALPGWYIVSFPSGQESRILGGPFSWRQEAKSAALDFVYDSNRDY